MRLVPVPIRCLNLPACLLHALHVDEDVASCSDSEHEPAEPPVRNTSLAISHCLVQAPLAHCRLASAKPWTRTRYWRSDRSQEGHAAPCRCRRVQEAGHLPRSHRLPGGGPRAVLFAAWLLSPQLAGADWSEPGIPIEWRAGLARRDLPRASARLTHPRRTNIHVSPNRRQYNGPGTCRPLPADPKGLRAVSNRLLLRRWEMPGRGRTREAKRALPDLVRDIETALVATSTRTATAEKDWYAASLHELIDHILQVHHAYMKEALPRLSELVRKVLASPRGAPWRHAPPGA